MIPAMRAALFAFGVLFTYFFGGTMEKFVLEVVRFFISVEPSNAIFFNLAHMAVLIVPLFLFGLILSISFADEPVLRRRLLLVITGMGFGIISYRIYQIWWILRGAGLEVDESASSWTESLTVGQLYFWEKILPYLLIGVSASLVPCIAEKESKSTLLYAVITPVSAFLWLFITRKIQNLQGLPEIAIAFLSAAACGLALGMVSRKIREF